MTRAAHDTLINQCLKSAGLSGSYENYTEAQLKAALVGGEFKMKSFGSFSASAKANPFMPKESRELVIKARTAPSTKVFSGMKSQQEVVTGCDQRVRITDIKVTNKYVYTKAGKKKRLVEMYVDMW